MHYELDYALRICSRNGRTQSCVHIYSQMGLYEEAVALALEVKHIFIQKKKLYSILFFHIASRFRTCKSKCR